MIIKYLQFVARLRMAAASLRLLNASTMSLGDIASP